MIRKLLLLGVIAAGLAGCGGAEHEPNLAKAVKRTEAVGSMRLAMSGATLEDGDEQHFACEGEADFGRKRFRLECGLGDRDEFEVVEADGTSYFRGGGLGFPGLDDRWVRFPEDLDESFADELSPERLLTMLRAASRDTVRLGEEEVRGASTVRYRLTVDCDEAELTCDGTAPVEVWIDDEGLVRQVGIHDDASSGTIEFFDFGANVDIEPPAADEVLGADDLRSLGPPPDPPAPCAEEASPISVERAITALERHGFSIQKTGLGCSPVVAASLSIASRGPEQTISTCYVLTNAEQGGFVTDVATLGRELERVERRLENLQCTFFVEAKPDESVARLDEALAELKATVHP